MVLFDRRQCSFTNIDVDFAEGGHEKKEAGKLSRAVDSLPSLSLRPGENSSTMLLQASAISKVIASCAPKLCVA